jgi:DNA-binding transcriptional ArsR family regulator
MRALAERHGTTLRAAALAFSSAPDPVASVLVGARSPGEVADAVAQFNASVPADFWRDLRAEGLLPEEVAPPDPRLGQALTVVGVRRGSYHGWNPQKSPQGVAMARPRSSPRTVEHPAMAEVSLQQVLEALVDPVRRAVVSQLARTDGDVSCGTFDVSVSRSTLTHHFNVLREAGVIRQHYVGTTKMNALRADEMEERFPGLLSALVAASVPEAGVSAR